MINYDMTHYGMWSARVKNGKSDHAPSHAHKPRPLYL